MRITILVATALIGALLGLAADSATTGSSTAKKKATGKAVTKSHPTSHSRTTASNAAHTTRKTASRTKKGSTRTASAHSPRQLTPTPERYKEIQQALVSKGYLTPEQVNGQWDDGSSAALKRFQTDQNIEASGKINSLSLIALGLGPKHETIKPTATPPVAPPQPQQP